MNGKNKQKGYVLVVVMMLSFLLSLTVISTFSVIVRNLRSTEKGLDELRDEVYVTSGEAEESDSVAKETSNA